METLWDWATIFAFAGLVTLLLQRSSEEIPKDKLWQYAPPAIGCAVANQIGNAGEDIWALLMMGGVLAYVILVLKVRIPTG
ncbi:XrtV sorting system accessory protein [Tsuneonella sp. HG249]